MTQQIKERRGVRDLFNKRDRLLKQLNLVENKTPELRPEFDGIDHINVYSKGATSLGRFLSNFALAPAPTPDGKFYSIEGYWYWLSCKDFRLRTLSGWKAKALGRELGADDWPDDEDFKNKIRTAIQMKLETYPEKLKELRESKLPLTHYYVYGTKVVDVPKAKWILEFLESFRGENK